MIQQSDIEKLRSKYRVKDKSQKDSFREFMKSVALLRNALRFPTEGMKYLSITGISFTFWQRILIRLSRSRFLSWLFSDSTLLIQKMILDNLNKKLGEK